MIFRIQLRSQIRSGRSSRPNLFRPPHQIHDFCADAVDFQEIGRIPSSMI